MRRLIALSALLTVTGCGILSRGPDLPQVQQIKLGILDSLKHAAYARAEIEEELNRREAALCDPPQGDRQSAACVEILARHDETWTPLLDRTGDIVRRAVAEYEMCRAQPDVLCGSVRQLYFRAMFAALEIVEQATRDDINVGPSADVVRQAAGGAQ